MKKPRRELKRPTFVAVPFRLRALTLALLAAAAGVLALVIALTPPEPPNFLVPRSARPDPPWPEGFVEFDPSEWGSRAREQVPLPSASSSPSSSSSVPDPARGASSARVVRPE